MTLGRIITALLGLAVVLPMLAAAAALVAALLGRGLGDALGAAVANRVAVAIGALWLVDTVLLAMATAWQVLDDDHRSPLE